MSNSRPAHKGYSYLAQSPVWTDLREFIIQWPDVSDDAAKRLSKQAYRLVDASKDALRGFYASISAFTDPHATANLIAIGIVLDEMNSFYRFSHRGDDDWDWFDATLYDGRFSTPDPDDDQKIEHPSYSGYFPARNELQNMSLKNVPSFEATLRTFQPKSDAPSRSQAARAASVKTRSPSPLPKVKVEKGEPPSKRSRHHSPDARSESPVVVSKPKSAASSSKTVASPSRSTATSSKPAPPTPSSSKTAFTPKTRTSGPTPRPAFKTDASDDEPLTSKRFTVEEKGKQPARVTRSSVAKAVVPTKRKAVIEMPDTSADSDADELEEEEEDELESASDAEYYRPADDDAAEEDRVQFDSKPHSVSRVQKAVLRTGKLIPCLVVEGSLTAHSTLTKTKYTLVGPNTNFAALNKMPDIHIVPIDPEKRAPIPTGRTRPKHTFHQLLDSENISLMYAALTEMAEIKNYKNTQMVFPVPLPKGIRARASITLSGTRVPQQLETLAYKDDYAIGSTSKSDSAPIDPVFTPPPLISLKTGKALDDWQAFPRTSNCINCIAIGCLCASHGLGVACTSCSDGTGKGARCSLHRPGQRLMAQVNELFEQVNTSPYETIRLLDDCRAALDATNSAADAYALTARNFASPNPKGRKTIDRGTQVSFGELLDNSNPDEVFEVGLTADMLKTFVSSVSADSTVQDVTMGEQGVSAVGETGGDESHHSAHVSLPLCRLFLTDFSSPQ
ncbi:hypothetical protein MKEN_00466600 [Mycena kentingensis (nom. inval.)]|nr:hypothetical protein MKEN_00466600 [Mycena kentingensis (nom. inval.)]